MMSAPGSAISRSSEKGHPRGLEIHINYAKRQWFGFLQKPEMVISNSSYARA
jgi:hypothetical protein